MSRTGKRRFRRIYAIFLLSAAVSPAAIPTALASTQGTVGRTSKATVRISFLKPVTVNVAGVSDMSVTAAAKGSDITWTNDICVYSTLALAGYRITATGSSSARGAFVLADGASTLPYHVAWNAGGAGNLSNNGVPLSPGVPSAPLGNVAADKARCQGTGNGATARLIVNVPQSALNSAGPGSYSESLTLLVAPN